MARPAHNRWLGRSVRGAASSFQEIHDYIYSTGGNYTTDCHKYQLIIFRRAVSALRSLGILIEEYAYDAAYGRIRYLMEAYLLLKALNRNQDHAAELLDKTRYEIRARGTPVSPETRLQEENKLGDLLEKQRSTLAGEEKRLYDHLSNRAMHPHTMSGAQVPGRYSSTVEKDCLQFGNFFAFGIAAQLIRTFETTDGSRAIRLSLEPVIVDIWTVVDAAIPRLLKDELDLWEPSRFG